jgi:23S rRNA (cytidine1920-2'-O)/16S rRNA (cytidine1409-2'-O)-methyltransferase
MGFSKIDQSDFVFSFWMTNESLLKKFSAEAENSSQTKYVSRAALKLSAALEAFKPDVNNKVCADFGSNVGGFVQVLLERGAKKVYAVEKGYGVVDWKLRKDSRVVVLEKTDARLVTLPEKVDLITSDTGWTRFEQIAPSIIRNLKDDGRAIILVKPHYEAQKEELEQGLAKKTALPLILERVFTAIKEQNFEIVEKMTSPILGAKGGNEEFLLLLKKA